MKDDQIRELERLGRSSHQSLAVELWLFLRDNKKWWMTPLILLLLMLAALVSLSATAAGPFIYALF
jgi:hypothetical protein